MAQDKRRVGTSSASLTSALALLLIVCLVECATEQRIISRGLKTSNLVKNNGWRSTRGGSCLSYGHSCWGAHGKRSAKPPATAPDWFIAKLLRHIDANGELERAREGAMKTDETNAIYTGDVSDYSAASDRLGGNAEVPELRVNRFHAAKPMLDDDIISKLKLWQIMRAASEEK